MLKPNRKAFNQAFDPKNYKLLVDSFENRYGHRPLFRVAESPVFIGNELKKQLLEASRDIVDIIIKPDFKEKSQPAVLAGQVVPNETKHTAFLQMDFGICNDGHGGIIPQLIEVQGFPSLYFFQHVVAKAYKEFYDIPSKLNHLFGGISDNQYISMLRDIIVGEEDPERVILLEIEPETQATAIDFFICRELLGVPFLCISELIVEGKDVYYKNEKGKKIQVKRIFNRVIFDELIQRENLRRDFYFTTQEYNVDWVGHPHWFFRISKHSLPWFKSKYVPDSRFFNKVDKVPEDLENYVLKPLYSFAGSGVILNLNKYDLSSIKDPENYILQRKVTYAPIVDTLDVPAKVEIRLLMLWPEGAKRPILVNNLARLSKGEMIGVKYNKDKTWVGGSVGFFE